MYRKLCVSKSIKMYVLKTMHTISLFIVHFVSPLILQKRTDNSGKGTICDLYIPVC